MIIFLRHAQAENNAKRILAGRTEGVHLTKTGLEQAERIAKYLKPLDISAIYSSPIERASHTAEIVAKNNSLEYIGYVFQNTWNRKNSSVSFLLQNDRLVPAK